MRQQAVLLIGAALLAGGVAIIVVGGDAVQSKAARSGGAAAGAGAEDAIAAGTVAPGRTSAEHPASEGGAGRHAARALEPLGPAATTDPATGDAGLEREAPRAPLSDIGQARPPKPGKQGETLLFRALATAAGTLEAKGYRITVAGVEPVELDETCDFQGQPWPCGIKARAAFRAWLRGRAISCKVPQQEDSQTVVAPCRVGKQDIAAWLVENGWARAVAAGPYADSGGAAAKAGKGIFGAPPAMTAPAMTFSESALPAPPASGAIITSEPASEPVAPTRPSGPLGVFPPAPAPPPAPAR